MARIAFMGRYHIRRTARVNSMRHTPGLGFTINLRRKMRLWTGSGELTYCSPTHFRIAFTAAVCPSARPASIHWFSFSSGRSGKKRLRSIGS
jgi:hypothetical protein